MMSKQPDIFIVDDDEAVRVYLSHLLQFYGFSVQSFSDAESFLSNTQLVQEGVVIVDLVMPGMSGEELLLKLKTRASTLSFMGISGVVDVQMAVRVMSAGAVTLLEKPFTEAELLDAVNRAFVQSRSLNEKAKRRLEVQRKLESLSNAEKIVLEGIMTDKTVRFCANRLKVSTRTVERMRKSILQRFGATSLVEVAVLIKSTNGDPPSSA